MKSADDYLNELRQDDMALCQGKLRTLAAKYCLCLARLPQFNQEIKALLEPQHCVDLAALTNELEPSLVQANEFLMALDLVPMDYPDQTDLSPYGQGLAKIMNSQTVQALAEKFAQRCKEAGLAAAKTKAHNVLVQNRHRALADLGYIDHGNGTVTDTKTRLMWKQCAVGQSGPECSGTVLKYDWDTALKIPKNLNLRGGFAGHSDWRVPTKEELETLVFDWCRPTICLDAFPNAPDEIFWCSSESVADSTWLVSFGNGRVSSCSDHDRRFAVRLVRASQ